MRRDCATERLNNGVRVRIGSADRDAQHRPARIRHPLSHDPADRLLPRLRRALLERHRQRLDVHDRSGRGAHHAAGGGAVPTDRVSTPARKAPAARTRPSSSSGRATSCSAPPGRCRRATGSPSRLPGRRAWSRRRAGRRLGWLLARRQHRRADRASAAFSLLLGYYYLRGGVSAATRRRGTIIPLFGRRTGMSAAAVRYRRQSRLRPALLHRRDHRAWCERSSAGLSKSGGGDKRRIRNRAASRCRPPSRPCSAKSLSRRGGSLGVAGQANHEMISEAQDCAAAKGWRRPISASCSPTTTAGRGCGLLAAVDALDRARSALTIATRLTARIKSVGAHGRHAAPADPVMIGAGMIFHGRPHAIQRTG